MLMRSIVLFPVVVCWKKLIKILISFFYSVLLFIPNESREFLKKHSIQGRDFEGP